MGTMYGLQMVAGLTAPTIKMVPINGGTFRMGAGSGPVTVSDFQMGVNPVTNQQYGSVLNLLGRARYFAMATHPVIGRSFLIARGDDPRRLIAMDTDKLVTGICEAGISVPEEYLMAFMESIELFEVKEHYPREGFNRSGQPAMSVNWYGAFVFAEILRMTTGVDYALPTEFQWEWAARGGPLGLKHGTATGELNPQVAHYHYDESVVATVDVNDLKYPSMENGLRHMTGNVAEWTRTWHGDLPQESVTDPIGPENGISKVMRGGAWHHCSFSRQFLRVTCRAHHGPDIGANYFGFRVVAPRGFRER